MADDAELLRSYADRDSESAFTEFVGRHVDLVYSAALRQVGGDHHAARDVAQNVFADAARKARLLASHPTIGGWLYTSTHYAAAKYRRAEQRRQVREHIAWSMDELTSPPADWSAVRPHLDAAMHVLSERDRDAILLRFFEQRPYAEIASRLGMKENAAQMCVTRAVEKLRIALARRGVTSTAVALGAALATDAVAASPTGVSSIIAGGAIAQAATATLGFAGVWEFMTMSKATVGCAGVLGVLALGTALYTVSETRASAAAIQQSKAELGQLTQQLRDANRRLTTASAKSGAAAATTTSHTGPTSANPTAGREARFQQIQGYIARELTENPQIRSTLGARERATMRLDHAELFRRLRLTDAQIDAFEKAMMKASSDELDILVAATEIHHTDLTSIGENKSDYPSIEEARQKIIAQRNVALRSVLGDDGMAAFEDYKRTELARAAVNDLTTQLLFTDEPLTATQRDAVVHAIATQSSEYQKGKPASLENVDWDAIERDVAKQLSPRQLTALHAYRAQNETESKP